jgi:Tol biopolymer transport system component
MSDIGDAVIGCLPKEGIVRGENQRIGLWAGLTLLSVCLLAANAHAQYFGQNKVRNKSHDFKVLKTDHFDIHYYDEKKDMAVEFGRMAERWYSRLRTILNHDLSGRQAIVVYASHPDFRGTTVLPDYIGETTGGVTEGLRRRIVMPLSGTLADTDHVLGHELIHAFQFDITTRRGPMGGSGTPGAIRLPLWFIEGMAEYLSVGAADPHTAMWMRDAVEREQLPAVSQLDDPKYFPYRWGQAFWAYVAGKYGDDIVGKILKAAGHAGSAEGAIASVLQSSIEQISQDWQRALKDQYTPVLQATAAAEKQARAIVRAEKNAGGLNVSPVLSPDGKLVAFFSERDQYSIDLFLAEAETGTIVGKITETALDPHFDSLQFMNSAGTWHPDGLKFAFGGIAKGRPQLSIYDLKQKSIEKRFSFAEIDDIFSPAWSPDGASILFSGMANGHVDLFLMEASTGKLKRLTDDPFAELQPAWSPDGKKVVYSTEKFNSSLEQMTFGELQLAVMDIATGDTKLLPAFPSGKHIGAQWSADGSFIYFLSDRDGISNIYRMPSTGGEIAQVTNLQTGVSGISKWSPAFSTAAKSDRLVFSAFRQGQYSLFMMEGSEALAGKSPATEIAGMHAGTLPPLQRSKELVRPLLRTQEQVVATSDSFKHETYRPSLSLEYIAPPSVSVGMSNFGAMIGGGTALYFSDLLGQHKLMTAFQTATTLDGGKFLNSLSGIATYENQKSRWNWGFTGGQVPYLTGGYGRSLGLINGNPVVFDQETRYWEISRQFAGTLARPLSRAQRLEFSAGFQNISFDAETKVLAYSAITGEFLGEQKFTPDLPKALNMGTANAALVYDTSIFGGTSPILGQSYRFEAGVAAGSLKYATFLADYRRYFRIGGPLTLAGRIMHFGRYGGDAESPLMRDLSVGYPSLVRGYEAGSFTAAECVTSDAQSVSCPAFDRLFGSRMAVANAELRLSLTGYRGLLSSSGLPPVEIAPFFDAGMAWRSQEMARAFNVARKPVSSYGISTRFNVLGFFIGQLSFVRANDRPGKGWSWEFSVVPGF